MNTERYELVKENPLGKGSHKSIEDGACIMEMVAYVAGETWGDHPECACPILTTYAIKLNDNFSDEHRQKLKPFIMELIGTRATPEIQIKRKQLLMFRNVTATYPLLLDLIKLPELAKKLREFKNNAEDMKLAAELLNAHKEEIWKARAYAAYAAAYAAAAYATAAAAAYATDAAAADADAYAAAAAADAADADAAAIREKIVAVSIETLKLAIEIK